ncbi:hypothetical protein NKG05_28070 [Oerskovia sp. M15]
MTSWRTRRLAWRRAAANPSGRWCDRSTPSVRWPPPRRWTSRSSRASSRRGAPSGPGGQLDAWSLEVVRIAAALSEYGIEPRHLRLLRTSADRHVGLVEQVVAPWRSQQSASARAHAGALAGEVGELFAKLHTVWVRQGVGDLTS